VNESDVKTPVGMHTITPHIVVSDAAAAAAWYVPRDARTVRITARGKKLLIETVGGGFVPQLEPMVAHMFRLNEDLSGFYALVQDDELSWCAFGAGRMLRAPTVFEDVANTT
jgi:hypothetical protein